MKRFITSFFIAGLLLAGSTVATAAPLDAPGMTAMQSGAFAGARLRIPLGRASIGRTRLSLNVAPMLRSEASDGRVRMQFGEGIGFGISPGDAATVTLGSRRLSFTEQPGANQENALGISTLGYVAIGTGLALVVGVLLFKDALDDASE